MATDQTYGQAMARAGQIRVASAQSPSAFVLWFDTVVVVEFSRTNHASYLYDRRTFDRLGIDMEALTIDKESDLKDRALGEWLMHQKGWQESFADRLHQHGVERGTGSQRTRAPA